jgi:hypothetical protein
MQALKALVIVMGVLIVAGTTVVVVTIYNRMQTLGEVAPAPAATPAPTPAPAVASSPTPAGPLPVFGDAPVAVPDGCRVVEMVPAGERLMLRLCRVARCNRILVLDLATGAVLGSFDLAPQD